jgi:hypothetical protein
MGEKAVDSNSSIFMCCLFNDALNSDCILLSEWMIVNNKIGRDVEGSGHDLIEVI